MIDLKSPDWGGTIKIGGSELSYRQAAACLGVVFWLSVMLIRTGKGGVASIATTAQFLASLAVLTTATRSVSWRTLFGLFFTGGFTLGVVVALGKMLGLTAGTISSNVLVAIVEEAALLLPPLWLLWRWRHHRLWSLGATDVFLLFAFCGAGFGMVETAYILNTRSIDQFSWLPVVAMDGDRIRGYYIFNGHEVWAGVAGAAAGLALMLRSRGAWVSAIFAGGIALGTIDHFALDARGSGLVVDALATLTAHGYLVVAAFIAGLLAVIAFDANVIYRHMPKEFWTLLLKPIWRTRGWASLLHVRAVAFGNYQVERANEKNKDEASQECLSIAERMTSQGGVVSTSL